MIRCIAAASLNGVIGQSGQLPWGRDYPEDLAWFRKQTQGQVVIMGRLTWESIGRPLPNRTNVVVSHRFAEVSTDPSVVHCRSYQEAFGRFPDSWVIGGSSAYQASLAVAGDIYVTTIPRVITGDNLSYMPHINPHAFRVRETAMVSPQLVCTIYERTETLAHIRSAP